MSEMKIAPMAMFSLPSNMSRISMTFQIFVCKTDTLDHGCLHLAVNQHKAPETRAIPEDIIFT